MARDVTPKIVFALISYLQHEAQIECGILQGRTDELPDGNIKSRVLR